MILFVFSLFLVFLLAAAFLGLRLHGLLVGDGGVEGRVLGVEVFLFDAAEVFVGGLEVVIGFVVVFADLLVAVEFFDIVVVAEGGLDLLLVDAEGEFLLALLVLLEVSLADALP